MGIYEYECLLGHVTELFVPLKDRPASTPCDECKEPAHFVTSAVPTTFRQMDRKAFKRTGR
jgi:hypothetical protein